MGLENTERNEFRVSDEDMKEYLKFGRLFQVTSVDKYRSRDGYVVYSDNNHYYFKDGLFYDEAISKTEPVDRLLGLYLKEAVSKYRRGLLSKLDACDNILK